LSTAPSLRAGLPKLENYFVDVSKVCSYGRPSFGPEQDHWEILPLTQSPKLLRIVSNLLFDDNCFIRGLLATVYELWYEVLREMKQQENEHSVTCTPEE
jgi:hypothetical protein